MHYLYIIYSESIDRYYVGESKDVINRLNQHNSHYFKMGFTKVASDWSLALSMKFHNKEEAMYLEKFIKRMKSRKFIQKVIAKPDILKDILNKKKSPGSPEASGLEAPH